MAESTGKNAAHIPGNGGYLADGPDLQERSPHHIYMMRQQMRRIRVSTRAV